MNATSHCRHAYPHGRDRCRRLCGRPSEQDHGGTPHSQRRGRFRRAGLLQFDQQQELRGGVWNILPIGGLVEDAAADCYFRGAADCRRDPGGQDSKRAMGTQHRDGADPRAGLFPISSTACARARSRTSSISTSAAIIGTLSTWRIAPSWWERGWSFCRCCWGSRCQVPGVRCQAAKL